MKNKGFMEFSMDQLNRYMSNLGRQQFNYEVFRAAYDSDPKIQNIVKDFDHLRVKLKSGESDNIELNKPAGGDTVNAMAKRATKIGDIGS